MASEKILPIEMFTYLVESPNKRKDKMMISFYSDDRVVLNNRFGEELYGKRIQMRFTTDAKHLCIMESVSEKAISFPKSRTLILSSATDFLKIHKISLPAQYAIQFDESTMRWQGDIIKNPTKDRLRKAADF